MTEFEALLFENEVERSFGDRVSIINKAKSLRKFGRTSNADADIPTTVATFQGAVVNETFATDNTVDSVVSDDAADITLLLVEGDYFDDDGDFVFGSEEILLNGTTPVALSRGYSRINRMFVPNGTIASPSTSLVGNVYGYDATLAGGVTLGTPDDPTATKCTIIAGKNQSEKCATVIDGQEYWAVEGIAAGITRASGASATVDVEVEYRTLGGTWRPIGLEITMRTDAISKVTEQLSFPSIIPKNSDVRMIATSNATNTTVSGRIAGRLAQLR